MIQLDWRNATAEAVTAEHGLSREDLREIGPAITDALETVHGQIRAGRLGYAKLPTRSDYADDVRKLVKRYGKDTTDVVVLGIGGSALGNIALQAALNPSTYNLTAGAPGRPRLFVLDNVDPAMVGDVLELLGPRLQTTLVNVISKSGETAETASQFMIFREKMREALGDEFAKRIVATTDAARGTLHEVARADGYEMLVVPDDVGGRFTVLSHVGLFSAAMCGIDIDRLLAGAAAMQARTGQENWRANPAAMLAAVKYVAYARKGKPMHVMMPYSNRLYLLADWYRQLWAESLGKAEDNDGKQVFAGPTPIKALGTTDQHSQVQLYREGPNDKLTVFVEVTRHPRRTVVPDAFADREGMAYLAGADLGALLNAEKTATEYAMRASDRPTVTLRLPEINAESVGEFIYLYEFTTSLMGELLNINPYDQPAVELGKKATFALMGRGGYEQMAREIAPFATPDPDFLV